MIPGFPNLRHLRALAAVARLGGVSRAAEHVHLSQPAITQAIAGMEATHGVPLFERSPEGMVATGAGRALAVRVDRAIGELVAGVGEALKAANMRGDAAALATRLTAPGLRALLALSQSRNYTQAAQQLGISQPSVHRAAREMERALAIPLFQGRARGVDLTLSAAHLARRAFLAAAELEQGNMELAALKGRDATRLTVGAMPLSRSRILPRAFAAMIDRFGHVQLRSVEGPYDDLLRGLRHGEIDLLIGALRKPPPAPDVVERLLFNDPLRIVVRAGHPLTHAPGPTLADTLAYPWVAPPREAPAGRVLWQALGIGDLAETPVKVVSSSQVLVRGLLMEGDYVTIISPNQVRQDLEDGRLVALPIRLQGGDRDIGITTREGWRPTRTQAALIDQIAHVAAAETGEGGHTL